MCAASDCLERTSARTSMRLGVGTREARSIAAILLSPRVPAEPAGGGKRASGATQALLALVDAGAGARLNRGGAHESRSG